MAGGNLLLIQAGGPTQVMNESLCAVLDAERCSGAGQIFGARRGFEGLIGGDLVALDALSDSRIGQIRRSPGAVLGSSRVRPSESDLERILGHLGRSGIHRAVLIGGNGTMHAALALSEFACSRSYELQVIGVPKTIDNDIPGTDRCPGYASAASFVAQSTRDLGMDVRSLAQPVSILETMGRDVGWLAAASVLARNQPCAAPHLVYIPEVPFDTDWFLADLDAVLRRQGWAVVVVSEGLRDRAGQPVYENLESSQRDDLGRALPGGVGRMLAETVTRRLKVRCRDEKPGLLGRASMLHLSPRDRMDAGMAGEAAQRALAAGAERQMVSLLPLEGGETGTALVPLDSVAGPSRSLPKEWLSAERLPVNEEFSSYLRPLIGPLLEYEDVFHGA